MLYYISNVVKYRKIRKDHIDGMVDDKWLRIA
jgi:hypothetical protein